MRRRLVAVSVGLLLLLLATWGMQLVSRPDAGPVRPYQPCNVGWYC